MGKTIAEIRSYIANTPAALLSPKSRCAFTPRAGDLCAIRDLENESGQYEAIALAIEYGRSIGLRMGRREAQLARGGERKAVVS